MVESWRSRSSREEEFVAEESRSQQSPAASRNDPLVPPVARYRTILERVKEKERQRYRQEKRRERQSKPAAAAIAAGPFETNLERRNYTRFPRRKTNGTANKASARNTSDIDSQG